MFVKALLLLSVIHLAQAGVWFHVGHGCMGAKGNKFAELTYNGHSSNFVGAVRLVHTKGFVANAAGSGRSNWGSSRHIAALATLITDDRNRILYPSPRVTKVSDHGWYALPGYAGTSPNLVFSDFCAPEYFQKDRKFRIWYGEDWSGYTESDNRGTSCMDVFFYLLGN